MSIRLSLFCALLLSVVIFTASSAICGENRQQTPVVKTIPLTDLPVHIFERQGYQRQLFPGLASMFPAGVSLAVADTSRNALIVKAADITSITQLEERLQSLTEQIPRVIVEWQLVEMSTKDVLRFGSRWQLPQSPLASQEPTAKTQIISLEDIPVVLDELLNAHKARILDASTVTLLNGVQNPPAYNASIDKLTLHFNSVWIRRDGPVTLQADELFPSAYGIGRLLREMALDVPFNTWSVIGGICNPIKAQNNPADRQVILFIRPTVLEASTDFDDWNIVPLNYLNAETVYQELTAETGTFHAELPSGITTIVPVEDIHALIVHSKSEDALKAFNTLMDRIDRAPRQVVIEAMLVRMGEEDAKVLLKGDAQSMLAKSLTTNRAQVVNAPRVLVMEGGSASFTLLHTEPETDGASGKGAGSLEMLCDTVTIGPDNSVMMHCVVTLTPHDPIIVLEHVVNGSTVMIDGGPLPGENPGQQLVLLLTPTVIEGDAKPTTELPVFF